MRNYPTEVPTKQRLMPLDNRRCHVLSTNLDELSPIDHKMFARGETTVVVAGGVVFDPLLIFESLTSHAKSELSHP